MKIKTFFDAVTSVLQHSNISTTQQNRLIRPEDITQNQSLPPIVTHCKDMAEFNILVNHFKLPNPHTANLSRFQMMHRFLSVLTDELSGELLTQEQGIAFLATYPITILHTHNVASSTLQQFCQQLALTTSEHQQSILNAWTLCFNEQGASIFKTNQASIHYQIILQHCQQDTPELMLDYNRNTPPLHKTELCIDVNSAKAILSSCQLNSSVKQCLLKLCSDTLAQEHSENMGKLVKLTTMILDDGRDIMESIGIIENYRSKVAKSTHEDDLSSKVKQVIEAYLSIATTLEEEHPKPNTPQADKKTTQQQVLALKYSSTLPCFTLLTTLPTPNVAPKPIVANFIANQQLDLNNFIREHLALLKLVEASKDPTNICRNIYNQLLTELISIALSCDEKMLFASGLLVGEAVEKIIQIIRPHLEPFLQKSVNEQLITQKISAINCALNLGKLAISEQISQECASLIKQPRALSPIKLYILKTRLLKQQALQALCEGNITMALQRIDIVDKYIDSGAKQVIPFLKSGYSDISTLLATVQNRRFNSICVRSQIAIHYLCHSQDTQASAQLSIALEKMNHVLPEDIVRKIKIKFRKTHDFNVDLSDNNTQNNKVFHAFLQQMKNEISDSSFLQCIEFLHKIETKDTGCTMAFNLNNNSTTITTNKKIANALQHAFSNHKIPHKSTNKKPRGTTAITLSDFSSIEPSSLEHALETVFSTLKPSKQKVVSVLKVPDSPDLRSLRFQLFKVILKNDSLCMNRIRERLLALQSSTDQNHVKHYCALLIVMASCRLALFRHISHGTTESTIQISIAQAQINTLKMDLSPEKNDALSLLSTRVERTEKILTHTINQEDIDTIQLSFNSAILSCTPDSNARLLVAHNRQYIFEAHEKIQKDYQALKLKFKAYSSTFALKKTGLMNDMASWLLRAAGELYITSIPDRLLLEPSINALKLDYQLIKNYHRTSPEPKCATTSAYYQLAKMLSEWNNSATQNMLRSLNKTAKFFNTLGNPELNLRFLNLQFILYMQLRQYDINLYSNILKNMQAILNNNSQSEQTFTQLNNLIRTFFNSFIIHSAFILLETNIEAPLDYSEFLALLANIGNHCAPKDTQLLALVILLQQGYDTISYKHHLYPSTVQSDNKKYIKADEFVKNLVLTMTKSFFNIILNESDPAALSQNYTTLHHCLVTLEQYLIKLNVCSSEKDLVCANLPTHDASILSELSVTVYSVIKAIILPNHLVNGDSMRLPATTLNPYNWYCAIQYGFLPQEKSEFIVNTMLRCHNVTKGMRADASEFALMISLCAKHPDNAYLNFTFARWCYSKDRENPQGYQSLNQAAQENHPLAHYYLGKMYMHGFFGKQQDQTQAAEHFKISADTHHHYQSYWRLAKHYQTIGEDIKMQETAVLAIHSCPLGDYVKERLRVRFGISKEQEVNVKKNSAPDTL